MPAPAQQDPSVRGPFDVTGGVDGPIVKNKTFFFGIWDNCVLSTVVTDSMGRFEFSNVGAAEYVVSAQRDRFSAPPANVSQKCFSNWWWGTRSDQVLEWVEPRSTTDRR